MQTAAFALGSCRGFVRDEFTSSFFPVIFCRIWHRLLLCSKALCFKRPFRNSSCFGWVGKELAGAMAATVYVHTNLIMDLAGRPSVPRLSRFLILPLRGWVGVLAFCCLCRLRTPPCFALPEGLWLVRSCYLKRVSLVFADCGFCARFLSGV